MEEMNPDKKDKDLNLKPCPFPVLVIVFVCIESPDNNKIYLYCPVY